MIVLGLGTNLGDRLQFLRAAVSELREAMTVTHCSPVYETPALLPEGAPPNWDMAFYNMAVRAETSLQPRELLQCVKQIEAKLGRHDRGYWGPREIDIDILAYDGAVFSEYDLTIPHTGLLSRSFALVPFADVAPEWVYPMGGTQGKTAGQLAAPLRASVTKLEAHVD